ncbi:MAG: hypothetical protein AAF797_00160 [Planctomycetota bacterium]
MTEPQTPTPDADLNEQLEVLHEQLRQREAQITQLERRQQIDARLTEAHPLDLGTARLLTEAAIQHMDEPDIESAIAELRRDKPWLFRTTGTPQAFPFAPEADPRNEPDPADEAAAHAASTGNRRDLLTYLRLRRNRASP